MGFTMWLQQKLNPAPADPTQAKIFAFLPFVLLLSLRGFAAGLSSILVSKQYFIYSSTMVYSTKNFSKK